MIQCDTKEKRLFLILVTPPGEIGELLQGQEQEQCVLPVESQQVILVHPTARQLIYKKMEEV